MTRVAVFDTETTGIPKHPHAKIGIQPRIIEFGGVLVDRQGVVVQELELLFDPAQPLESIITKITGLTDADLRGQPMFEAQLPFLREFFAAADVVIAHNLPFDMTIIDLEIERLGAEAFSWPKIQICTVQENAERWGRRPKLTELYLEVAGEKLAQTHRALDDVAALVEVCRLTGVLDEIDAAIALQN